MTVQERPERGDNPALMWLGHHAFWFMVPYVPLTITANVPGTPVVVADISLAALVILVVSVLIQWRYHDQRLCERCIAASPLNPQAEVDRRKRVLHLYHSAAIILVYVPIFAALAIAAIKHWSWLSTASNIAFLALIAGGFVVFHVHRRLYPWCPWCHWDEGGDHEPSPDLPQVPQETR